MNVGLIGCTGKTGGWVLERCIEKDYKVFALVRNPDKLKTFTETSTSILLSNNNKDDENAKKKKENLITTIEGDATSVEGMKSLLESAPDGIKLDVIISTIGSPSKEHIIVKKAAQALVDAVEDKDEKEIPRIVWMTSTGINEATDQAKSYPLFGSTQPSRWFFGYGGFGFLQFKVLIPYVIGQELWDDMGYSEDLIRGCEKLNSKTVIVRPTNMHPVSEHKAFSDDWWKEGGTGHELEYVLNDADDPPPGKWIFRGAIANALIDLCSNESYDGSAKSLFAAVR